MKDRFKLTAEKTVKLGLASEGDLILVTVGVSVSKRGTTNAIKTQMIGSKLLEARSIGQKSVVANAVIASSAEEAVKEVKGGMVLVVSLTDKEYIPVIEKAAAIIVKKDRLTSHATVVGIAQDTLVVIDAKGATTTVTEGELITVDSRRGVVYRGETTTI